jgi:glucose/arabinose dehydrogenase
MSRRLIGALVVTFAVALTGASGAGAATTRVVMSGLDNPRGLAFGPEGALYVAEAGRGGPGPRQSRLTAPVGPRA